MKTPEYMVALDTGRDSQPYILQTSPPVLLAYTWVVPRLDQEKVDEWNLKAVNGDGVVKCRGYSVYVTLSDVLSKEPVPPAERQRILEEMADFFLASWISQKRSRYRAFEEGRGDGGREFPSGRKLRPRVKKSF